MRAINTDAYSYMVIGARCLQLTIIPLRSRSHLRDSTSLSICSIGSSSIITTYGYTVMSGCSSSKELLFGRLETVSKMILIYLSILDLPVLGIPCSSTPPYLGLSLIIKHRLKASTASYSSQAYSLAFVSGCSSSIIGLAKQ